MSMKSVWCSLHCTSLVLPEISQILVSTPITVNACQRYLAPGPWELRHRLSWVHVWQEGWNSTIPLIHFLVVAVVADSAFYKEAFQKERKACRPIHWKLNPLPEHQFNASGSTVDIRHVSHHVHSSTTLFLVIAPCGNSSRKIIKWIYIFIQKK